MKTEKRRTYRGAVLFTVVSVMSLLILFLMSTLVLAVSANKRAHKSYSSSQARYTARTAVDSILAAVSVDEDYAEAMANLANVGDKFNVTVDIPTAGTGRITNAVVAFAGKKQYYSSTEQQWVTKNLISITADVLYAGETTTMTSYILQDPPSGGDGSIALGFVSVGTAQMANHASSYGGTYFGIGMNIGQRMYIGDYSGDPSSAAYDPLLADVTLSNKLYLNVEEGKTAEIRNVDGKLGYYVDTSKVYTYKTQNDQVIEAPFVVNGNFYQPNALLLVIPEAGSGMAVWGDYTVGNGGFNVKTSTPNLVTDIKRFSEIPYVYVDGQLSITNGATFGNTDTPLNFFLGSIDLNNNNSSVYGNVYCYDTDKTSKLGGTGTTLYAWNDSLLKKTEMNAGTYAGGNFYTKGNLEITANTTINGDLIVEGDLTVNADLKVTGNVVVGGTFSITGGNNFEIAKEIHAANIAGTKFTGTKTERANVEKVTVSAPTIVKIKNGGYKDQWGNTDGNRGNGWYDAALLTDDAAGLKDVYTEDPDGYDMHDTEFNDVAKGYFKNYAWEISGIIKDDGVYQYQDSVTHEILTEDELYILTDAKLKMKDGTEKEIKNPADWKSGHDGVLFPKYAEKAIILGYEAIDGSTPITDTKVLKTVGEIEAICNFAGVTIKEIAGDSSDLATKAKIQNEVNSHVYTAGNLNPQKDKGSGYAELPVDSITGRKYVEIPAENCTISGGFNNDIIIRATTSDIWVKVSGDLTLSNGANIIYDDYGVAGAGKLNLFIDGSVSAYASGAGIVTTTYVKLMQNDFEISTTGNYHDTSNPVAVSPNIAIYSPVKRTDNGNAPAIQLDNLGLVTACIEAPYLNFGIKTSSSSVPLVGGSRGTIWYNAHDVNTSTNGQIGVIGILDVGNVTEAQNNWLFLYVPKGANPPVVVDKNKLHDYVVIGYEGY